MTVQIPIDREKLAEFCRRWRVVELALFGSVLRDDFDGDSDVDVLVSFHREADWGLWDHARMQDELSQLFGRQVDLVTRQAIEGSDNWLRKQSILNSAETVHVER